MTMLPQEMQQSAPTDPSLNLGGGLISRLISFQQNRQAADKQATAAASATERYLKANSDQFGLDPSQINQSANESAIQYNQRLNSMISNVMVGQEVKKQQALIAAQQAQTQGINLQNQGMGIANQQQALALAQSQRMDAYIRSFGNGQLGAGQPGQPGQPPAQVAPQTQPQAPSNVPYYLQPNATAGSQPPAQAQPNPQQAQVQPMPPTPASATATAPGVDPSVGQKFSQWFNNYVQTVRTSPTAEASQNFLNKAMAAAKPVGLVPAGVQIDGQGHVIGQKWARVTQDGIGNRTVGSPDMVLPVGQMPQGQVLDSKTFQPLTPSGVGQGNAGTGQTVAPMDTPTSVPMTQDRQQAIKDATEQVNMLSQNEQKIQTLGGAVAANIKNTPDWMNRFNSGDSFWLGVRRALYGDSSGQELNQGVANNLNSIMDNMRSGSKNGSLGMRLTTTEWDQLKQGFPAPGQPVQTQVKGWQNLAAMNTYAKNYAQSYLKNLQTMAPGDAATKANASTPRPNVASLALPPPPDNTVKVMDPSGRTGTIPTSNLGKALAAGYKQVQ